MSTATVVVGCKLPHGLICELGIDRIKDAHGMVTFVRNPEKYTAVTLKGANDPKAIGGYGMTEGVSKDFMDSWMGTNKFLPAVKNGLIFVLNDAGSAVSRATEGAALKTGLEPLIPKAPPKGREHLAVGAVPGQLNVVV